MNKVYGQARKQAKESAKHWKASKRRNWKRYAIFKKQAKIDAITVEEYTRDFVSRAYQHRHKDAELFDNILEALHSFRYLKTLVSII